MYFTLRREKPDVVLLQEVVSQTEMMMREALEKLYSFCSGNKFAAVERSSIPSNNYYTMVLVKKRSCKVLDTSVTNFANSVMNRNLLRVRINFRSMIEFYAMTTHLESTKDFGKSRIDQLRECFREMSQVDEKYPVFFGGDLNIRDTEVIETRV